MPSLPISLDTLINRINQVLEVSPRQTTISGALTDSATSATVASATGIAADTRIEINDEVILVGAAAGTSLSSLVRGYSGTTAAAHSSGDVVRVDPRYLRTNMKEAVNVALDWLSVFVPRLTWDTSTAGNFQTNRWIYAAPADATKVRRVIWQVPGWTEFRDINFSQLEPYPTDIVSTGKGFHVDRMGLPGRPVKVLFERPWPELSDGTDEVPDDFPQQGDHLLVDGAVLYLLGYRVVPKFRLDETVFHRESGGPTPPNIAMQQIAQMQQSFLRTCTRLASERAIDGHPRKTYVGLRRTGLM